MTKDKDAVVVFTGESVERIIAEGATSAWRLDPTNARKCKFVVCIRNLNSDWPEVNTSWPKPSEADRSAFLVGKVKSVVPKKHPKNRFEIHFSEFARVEVNNAWKGLRNPVMYSSLEDMGISESQLTWQDLPQLDNKMFRAVEPEAKPDSINLSIAEAKAGLARTFGITPEQIEITIKG